MTAKHGTLAENSAVRVGLGEPILESGYTLVPNLLLDHYPKLGLDEGTALFVIRLLRQRESDIASLLDSPHLEKLQELDLLHLQRWPDRIEVRLDSLFHNLTRLAHWLNKTERADEFELEIPPEMSGADSSPTGRFDSEEFQAEMTDVLAAFSAANKRNTSPAEKEQIRNLALRFDVPARAAAEPSNGPAWVMAALRSALERRAPGGVSVSDLEQALKKRIAAPDPALQAAQTVRQDMVARIRQMPPQEKEALGTVVMAYQGITGQSPNDQIVLTLMQLSQEYGSNWVLSAIHEAGSVQTLISPEYVASILIRWRSEGRISDKAESAESTPLTDPLLARVVAFYEQEIGPLTPQAGHQLTALTKEFDDPEEWQRAFAEAAKSNARNLRYVEAVLRKKGKKQNRSSRPSKKSSYRRRKTVREGEWTEEELETARRESLSETPIDIEAFLGEEA